MRAILSRGGPVQLRRNLTSDSVSLRWGARGIKSERAFIKVVLLALVMGLTAVMPQFASAQPYTVINTGDSGAGSLRQAILDANANLGPDNIVFDIPGAGPHTIAVATALPFITDAVTIDGYTQTGASINTVRDGSDAVLMIELTSSALPPYGLYLNAPNVTVRGLVINGFQSQIGIAETRGVVEGNYLGTNVAGDAKASGVVQYEGVYAQVKGALGTRIGGPTVAQRNVISGFVNYGVNIVHTANPGIPATDFPSNDVDGNPMVQGNFIGTDKSGTAVIANNVYGVYLAAATRNPEGAQILGSATAPQVISGSWNTHIHVGGSHSVRMKGNYVGTEVTATAALGPKALWGVDVSRSTNVQIIDNIIGNTNRMGIVGNGCGAIDPVIQGNIIGSGITRTEVIPNGKGIYFQVFCMATVGTQPGVYQIGGPDPGQGNFIANSPSSGFELPFSGVLDVLEVQIEGNEFRNNSTGILLGYKLGARGVSGVIQSNQIYENVGGVVILGHDHTTGDPPPLLTVVHNTIHSNREGVALDRGRDRVSILSNSIFDNTWLGISLFNRSSLRLANDVQDVDDSGSYHPWLSNLGQNYPVIVSASSDASSTTVNATLNSTPNTTFLVQFFSNSAIGTNRVTDFGEGETYLGETSVTTDGSGDVALTATLPVASAVGSWITMTATDPDGNTSEFSGNPTDDGMVIPGSINSPPEVAADTDPDAVNEGETAANTGTVTDPDGDTVTLTASVGAVINNDDGTWSWSYATSDGPTESQTVTITADDGSATAEATFVLTVNNVAPTVTAVTVPMAPVAISEQPISASGDFTDPAGSADETYTCTVDYDDGTGLQAGSTAAAGTCEGPDHTYAEAGVYTVTVDVTDDDEGVGSATAETMIVIYDPSGGFVTGGGWIDSPEGAYVADPLLFGKASFGFVSKYKKGANVPTGNTEFQFKAGDLNFHSSSYEWLVIAGQNRAKYKGVGTINGSGNYGFMLTAVDDPDGDTFRIKIWDKDNADAVEYDNQIGAEEDSYEGTALGGGNIVVHTGKGGNAKTDELAEVPTEFALHGNYPNPFNPSTSIGFDLPASSNVRLIVFDLLGREVVQLVDGEMPAGKHAVTWLAGGVPSGLYLYRIDADDFSKTRQMVLLK